MSCSCTCVSIAWAVVRDADYTDGMCPVLTLVCLLHGLLCGVLIMRHVPDVYTCVDIGWTSVRSADYTACGGCLHLCVYRLDFCAGC